MTVGLEKASPVLLAGAMLAEVRKALAGQEPDRAGFHEAADALGEVAPEWFTGSAADDCRDFSAGRADAAALQRLEGWLSGLVSGEEPDADEEQARLRVVDLAGVEPEEVAWLWRPYVPLGKLTLVDGDPGAGKSWLTLAVATAVSTGAPLPGDDSPREPGNVLLIGAEDSLADTVVPRLRSMGAGLARIRAVQVAQEADGAERVVDLGRDLPLIEALLEEWRPALLVIDPIQAHVGGGLDIHRANEVRSVMAPLALLAERYRAAVLVVRHLRKSSGDKALYRGLGTIDFAAAARSVLLVGQDPDDPTRRGVAQIKSSLAPGGETIAFRLDSLGFTWTGAAPELTAERLLAVAADGEEPSALEEAEAFLLEELADGPVPAKQVQADAKAAGISEITLRRAKARLGVEAVPQRDERGRRTGWMWQLPGGPGDPPDHPGGGRPVHVDDHLDAEPESRANQALFPDDHAREDDHLDKVGSGCGFPGASPDDHSTRTEEPDPDDHLDLLDRADPIAPLRAAVQGWGPGEHLIREFDDRLRLLPWERVEALAALGRKWAADGSPGAVMAFRLALARALDEAGLGAVSR